MEDALLRGNLIDWPNLLLLLILFYISGFPCAVSRCAMIAFSVDHLMSHYRTIHREESDFHVPCVYLPCVKSFRSESGLRKHVAWHQVHHFPLPRQEETFSVGQAIDIDFIPFQSGIEQLAMAVTDADQQSPMEVDSVAVDLPHTFSNKYDYFIFIYFVN